MSSNLTHHMLPILEEHGREKSNLSRTPYKDLILPEEVLRTVLIEVEGIMNSKPLGYVSSDISDPDPITPNLLLYGNEL
ncbi:hypothetical protein QQF64_001980 [Cirrhinus molitorella]|uniref:Uncharacterized protein n=1 Tax=Cirrhinus molitorella TaxID=172907 RepID=A0ABR3MP11_9TELE